MGDVAVQTFSTNYKSFICSVKSKDNNMYGN